MYRVGIDALGGDNGSFEVVKSVAYTLKTNKDISITIFGDEAEIINNFASLDFDYKKNNVNIVNATEKIEMNDHPVFALRSKTNSSIAIAGKLLVDNGIDIFISAGNTGALVALATFYLKPIDGINRPVVAAILPTYKGPLLLIDSGCNMDSKPDWLHQYSIIGSVYYNLMFKNNNPKIGLLSVGPEENKGNQLTLESYKLLKDETKINFVGNVEARDLPFGICDIIIADGFSGNVFLKTYEGTAKMIFKVLKSSMTSNLISKIGALILKPTLKRDLKKYDAKIYGGAPILGASSIIIKCHGNATYIEYMYAFNQAYELLKKDTVNVIKNNFSL